jgi:hypothetical protein
MDCRRDLIEIYGEGEAGLGGFERALVVGHVVAVALGLASCAAGRNDPPELVDEAPECRAGFHLLPAGFELTRSVDYVGDFQAGVVIAQTGEPCAQARSVERCEAAFDEAQLASVNGIVGQRTLITTEGDQVRMWSGASVLALFGEIDTPAEALFFVATLNFGVDCTTRVTRMRDGFRLWVRSSSDVACGSVLPPDGQLDLLADGTVRSLGIETTFTPDGGCTSRSF